MKSRIRKPSENPTTAHRKHVNVFSSRSSNFFISTSKRKAPESAPRSTALTRARREKLRNF
jgi:hypothetical protein